MTHPVRAAIAQQIAVNPKGRITFAEFMETTLYHPEHGYYATKAVNLGSPGDFFTSVHLSADFGELLAEQFFQMWEILGRPGDFSLVEMGAGQGVLAVDILKYLARVYPDFFASLNYIIIEKSAALRKLQQRLEGLKVQIKSDLTEIPPKSITGCFFSNELVDAMPIHQFILKAGQVQEVYVTSSGEDLSEVIAEPSTDELIKYFDLVGIKFTDDYPDGYRSEVNLAALSWMKAVADRMQRGYVLTIDYGYPAHRYYNPRRSHGTLQCYYHHTHHDDPYINLGEQDITAHVDFTALEVQGQRYGLQPIALTRQEMFLMSLGLGSRLAALSTSNQPLEQILQRRQVLHEMFDPAGLGGFGVLIQSKGLTEIESAEGLRGLEGETKVKTL